jgi:hypothetical protein
MRSARCLIATIRRRRALRRSTSVNLTMPADMLIHNDDDLHAVEYSMRVTGTLYAAMLQVAIEQADNPKDWGWNAAEMARRRAT